MDEFGVFVHQYGIKARGKSAPMAANATATAPVTAATQPINLNTTPNFDTGAFFTSSYNSTTTTGGSLLDDQSDLVWPKTRPNYTASNSDSGASHFPAASATSTSTAAIDSINLESVFSASLSFKSEQDKPSMVHGFGIDPIFSASGFSGATTVVSNNDHDLLSSMDPVDDFLENLGKMRSGSLPSRGKSLDLQTNGNKHETGNLIPGFTAAIAADNKRERAEDSTRAKDFGLSSIEELENFAVGRIQESAHGHANIFADEVSSGIKVAAKSHTVDEDLYGTETSEQEPWDTDFFVIDKKSDHATIWGAREVGKGNGVGVAPHANSHHQVFDGNSFFNAHAKKRSASVPEINRDSMNAELVPDLFSGASFSMEKTSPVRSVMDEFSSFLGATSSGKFDEENEGRRRARLGHHHRTQARMAQALADMNEREWQAQQEQEERRRIADRMDAEMKHWAAGKEGNLRALLSSLQQVLWPECGWQPVSLSDLITPSQVKIVYKKAALCVHPDKVQQKGANLHQKYVAEKVFDLLKEAWNKFNTEELR